MSPSIAGSAAVIRPPLPPELPRILHLFRGTRLRTSARLLAAELTKPVPRFVAAAGWWTEGAVARFQLACQPGAAHGDALPALIEAVLAAAREARLESVQYAELLADDSPWVEALRSQGFERLRSERFFEIAYRDVWDRVMRLYERHRGEIPTTWRTDSLRGHGPETILALAAPHRLLPPEDIRQYWQATTAGGFDLDLSCILFDDSRPFGTLLARRFPDSFFIDVQVVAEPNPRRRSLGDLCVLHYGISRLPPGGATQWIRFRSGEQEHRQTANLALRMGGREIAARHVLARKLSP